MLGSAGPSTATVHTSTSTTTPASPTRSSRLRGLSYLRNYTREHLAGAAKNETPSHSGTLPTLRSASATARPLAGSPTQSQDTLRRRGGTRSSDTRCESGEEPRTHSVPRGTTSGPVYADTTDDPACLEEDIVNSATSGDMTRGRAATAQHGSGPTASAPARTTQRRATLEEASPPDEPADSTPATSTEASLPTIRFIPHVESRSSRPSLLFSAVSRKLKQPNSIVRVGRYSERDTQSASPNSSVSPVGFKSKVVSRRHCEFWCANGQWYVKDIKSSSGTFLNHVRLSSAGTESRPYPVNDGDVIQLGIDFKGGEEIIFRCVKIRIECNRGWQKSLNTFNTSAHKRLLNNNKGRESDSTSTNSSDCSICLNPVAPCQALFVAPCSHVWHYKCIRNLVQGPNWPNFLCPNCRLIADLEADVEPPEDYASVGGGAADEEGIAEEVENADGDDDDHMEAHEPMPGIEYHQQLRAEQQVQQLSSRGRSPRRTQHVPDEDLAEMMHTTTLRSQNEYPNDARAGATPSGTRPVNIHNNRSASSDVLSPRSATPTSDAQFALAAGLMNMPNPPTEGATTPRNAAGPFVLDGSHHNT